MSEALAQPRLDLANPLTADAELVAKLLERHGLATETGATGGDQALARIEVVEQRVEALQ
jgi:lysophospholipid acyltransferase (LPLAT)-like uncharacterized protein